MIVEFLRVFFSEDERLQHLQTLAQRGKLDGGDRSLNSEYWAASLAGTQHDENARELTVRCWLDEDQMSEAAYALMEFEPPGTERYDRENYTADALGKLGRWLDNHADREKAIVAFRESLRLAPDNCATMSRLATSLAMNCGLQLSLVHMHQSRCVPMHREIGLSPKENSVITKAQLRIVQPSHKCQMPRGMKSLEHSSTAASPTGNSATIKTKSQTIRKSLRWTTFPLG